MISINTAMMLTCWRLGDIAPNGWCCAWATTPQARITERRVRITHARSVRGGAEDPRGAAEERRAVEERSGAEPWTGAKAADVALARELSELAHAEEELLRHVQEESLEDAFQAAESHFESACRIRRTSPETDQRRIIIVIRELLEKLDANMLAFGQPRSKQLM